jgi:hypothetical protein
MPAFDGLLIVVAVADRPDPAQARGTEDAGKRPGEEPEALMAM